jgi:hypothetical protein
MDEAKYCEDIVPLIKLSLESAGYTNEHDRLGHFESRIPIDTFFGLATQHKSVRFFGFQFKAPNRHLRWDLTHTDEQFDKIRLDWPTAIYYALPWYTDLVDSSLGLQLCAFVDPMVLPERPSKIVRSEYPIPDEYIARLLCCCSIFDKFVKEKFDDTFLLQIYSKVLEIGPKQFIERIILDETRNIFAQEIEIPENYLRLITIPLRDVPWQYISDWNGKGEKYVKGRRFPQDRMTARVLLNVRFNGKGNPLTLSGKVQVEKLEICAGPWLGWTGFPGMTPFSNMLDFKDSVLYLEWQDVLSRIESGSFGFEITSLDKNEFKEQFSKVFNGDENAVLVWYSHIEKVFYAVETKRIARWNSYGELGFMNDSLIAGLSPESRTRISKAAIKLGIHPSSLLEKIVRLFLSGNDIN